jgi:hypothetical protein
MAFIMAGEWGKSGTHEFGSAGKISMEYSPGKFSKPPGKRVVSNLGQSVVYRVTLFPTLEVAWHIRFTLIEGPPVSGEIEGKICRMLNSLGINPVGRSLVVVD